MSNSPSWGTGKTKTKRSAESQSARGEGPHVLASEPLFFNLVLFFPLFVVSPRSWPGLEAPILQSCPLAVCSLLSWPGPPLACFFNVSAALLLSPVRRGLPRKFCPGRGPRELWHATLEADSPPRAAGPGVRSPLLRPGKAGAVAGKQSREVAEITKTRCNFSKI